MEANTEPRNASEAPRTEIHMNRRDLFRLTAGLAAGSSLNTIAAQSSGPQATRANGPHRNFRVVIVGAGISGLAAAQRLRNDFGLTRPGQVIVLESRDRIGGRIHTDFSMGTPIELGANWIHGANGGNPITGLANQIGAQAVNTPDTADLHDVDGSSIPGWVDGMAYTQFMSAYGTAESYIQNQPTDVSVGQAFDATGAGSSLTGRLRRTFDWYRSLLPMGWTGAEHGISGRHADMGAAFPGPDRVLVGGYSQIVDHVAQGVDVRLSHIVHSIDHSGERVRVVTNQGNFHADACICTLPLGVLKAGIVDFHPLLPTELESAIARMGFGAVIKMAMEFPSSFWSSSSTFLSYFGQTPGEVTDWFNLESYSGVPILSTWAHQDYARALENLSPTERTNRVMQDLRTMYGNGIPDPTRVLASGWNSDPNTLGSYSYPAVGSTPADYDLFTEPVRNKLFFAGEHTNSLYPSTVHGAFLSGRDAAARLVRRTRGLPRRRR